LYLGYNSKASADGTDNEIVIGYNAIGKGSNTATYGNTSMTKHIFESGNVGIGTTAPGTKLDVDNSTGDAIDVSGGRIIGLNTTPVNANEAVPLTYLQSNYTASTGSLWNGTLNGTIYNGTTGAGNVGIGTTNPGVYKLKVVGNVAITGTLETQTGSDFAEEFSTTAELEPGTVVVLGDEGYKSAKISSKSYDQTVIGVVSDNPSIIAGRQPDLAGHKAIVAMVGVVKVKVSSVNGIIKKGDLLTTSSINGFAMKANLVKTGTIIGKALEDMEGKKDEIKVLVNLQ